MTTLPDASTLALIASPLRLAAAFAVTGCGLMLALVVVRRVVSAADRRGSVLRGGAILGTCLWAASLCVASVDGGGALPLPAALFALLVSLMAAVALLAGACAARAALACGAAVGAGALWLGVLGAWAWAFDIAASPGTIGAIAAAALLGQGATLALLRSWARVRPARRALAALACAAVHGLPWWTAALLVTPTASSAPGPELLFALLAGGMALLAVQAGGAQHRLAGAHQRLGAQLEQATAHLERTPLSDPLTGTLSRLGLEGALREAAMLAERQGRRVALLAIGLDGFKSVNHSFGHALGDSVLREVARRLNDEAAALVAEPGLADHALARLGGDEFMLMLQGVVDRPSLARAAARVMAALDGPLHADDQELRVSASIGIACFPEDGGVSKLVARAHAAMQAAKAAGGSTHMSFEPRMEDDARDRLALLRDLRQAIEQRQLELFYQPKIDARSGQVTGAEALLRWHHPVRGTLSPDLFVPLAERHGLIGALGNWVIEDACRQARVWRERGLKMRVAINLSVFQMRQNDLVERIQAALKRHGVNPSRLTCEITESVAMEDTQATQRTFERLGQAGIHLSIDDFGTGYSSLAYLRRLPATELKIDRSFVADLDSSADARAIVDAVLKLAHAIGLKVVAEGVENIRQRDILLQLGCDEFQGYLFARPMSARALLLWAVDDRPAKNAFRPSLFSDTATSSLQEPAAQTVAAGARPPRAGPGA